MDNKQLIEKLKEHDIERMRYKKLLDYYKGKHDILHAEKDKGKPNNKIVTNFPRYMTDIVVGYSLGSPISYYSEQEIEKLEEIYDNNDEAEHTFRLGKISAIASKAFELIYLDEDAQLQMAVESPECGFMVYDDSIKPKPLMYIRRLDKGEYEFVEVWDKSEITTYKYDGKLTLQEKREHFFKRVPVIEYNINHEQMGVFEREITKIDAYNKAQSEKLNDIEYFADSYLKLINMSGTRKEDVAEMRENKILLLDENGDADFLVKPSNIDESMKTKEELMRDIFVMSLVPNLTDDNFSGQASGVALRYKLWGLEQLAGEFERNFTKSLNERKRIIAKYLNHINSPIEVNDIAMQWTRNIPEDIKSEAEALEKLLGRVSTKTAFAKTTLIENPEHELELIRKEREGQADIYGVDSNDIPETE